MSDLLPKRGIAGQGRPAIRVAPLVLEAAALDVETAYGRLATRAEGLTAAEAAARLSEHGPNVLARDQRPGFLRLLWRSVLNPLVILLVVLATVSFSTGDARAGAMMVVMVVLSVSLKLFQEAKADSTAAKLKRHGAARRPTPLLAITVACYLALTQAVKMWLLRRRWI